MKIRDKLHKIDIVDKDATIKSISYILHNDTPDVLIVVDNNRVAGIVTDSDLIMKVKQSDLNSETLKVKDIMTPNVISIEIDKKVSEAIDMMVEHSIQKLLVTQDGAPVGILYGEDILELDEEKWKEIVFNQTIDEVYKLLVLEPNSEIASVMDTVQDMDRFTNMESKVEFDLFVYQQGLVRVAYFYLKENRNKPLKEIKDYIKDNYSDLVVRYSQES
ncbi:CBS domain-containing protein [Candidatus Woesearchaeota archaeon]|nr:CBS domain-containing protein [Candidatus Woesearchaeota archaeon]MBI2130997.1 CBS domain-containing protein [Candidatus Woesearchaeota archaeon]